MELKHAGKTVTGQLFLRLLLQHGETITSPLVVDLSQVEPKANNWKVQDFAKTAVVYWTDPTMVGHKEVDYNIDGLEEGIVRLSFYGTSE